MASPSLQAVPPSEGDFALDASRAPFLAFVADEASENALRAGLAQVFDDVRIRRGTVKTATKVLSTEPTPHRLLVDISGVDDPVRALDELANVCTPDVKVFVIGERTDVVFYRHLTRYLGAEEYLFKPLSRNAIVTVLAPLVANRQQESSPKRGCRIVAVCGARGGVGATTTAIGIASEVASIKGHVALLDMHLRGGSAALALGAKAGAGLRIALEEPERLDALFLDRVAMPVGERLHLIAAEESFAAFPRPTPEGVEKLLALMQERFTHVVVDLPNPPTEAEALVLRAAKHVVIVMGPDIAGVRDANATQQLVADLSPAAQICTILNRSDRPGALKATIIEEGLHHPIDISIGEMSRQLSRSANLGRPALIRESGLVTALAPLLQELTGVAAAQPAKRGLSALWKLR